MRKFSALIFFFILTTTAWAYSGDMSVTTQDISIIPDTLLEGQQARIYATVTSRSGEDLLGIVRFYDNGAQIGADQPISIFKGKTDGVFINWTPASYGNRTITVKIFPWEPDIDDPSNNSIETTIYIGQDTDHDGITNTSDPDDDNDGVPDETDHFSLNSKEQFDTDGDGKGDNTDTDDDNDDVPDKSDDLPLDPNETIDTDKDGIGNIADIDDDGDSIPDTIEENTGTNPTKADSDGDGVADNQDAFAMDPQETIDTDADGLGDNTDTDDDNDKITDAEDSFPFNKGPIIQLLDEDFNIDVLEKQTFDASPSYDEDGKITGFQWEIDGKKLEGDSVDFKFRELGTHDINLTVTDDSGESITKNFQINVTNTGFYLQIGATLLALLLALLIYIKYIARREQSERKH